jgi:hypothetical protein
MLENCLSGSEGGGAIALPTPIIASGASRSRSPLTLALLPVVSAILCRFSGENGDDFNGV